MKKLLAWLSFAVLIGVAGAFGKVFSRYLADEFPVQTTVFLSLCVASITIIVVIRWAVKEIWRVLVSWVGFNFIVFLLFATWLYMDPSEQLAAPVLAGLWLLLSIVLEGLIAERLAVQFQKSKSTREQLAFIAKDLSMDGKRRKIAENRGQTRGVEGFLGWTLFTLGFDQELYVFALFGGFLLARFALVAYSEILETVYFWAVDKLVHDSGRLVLYLDDAEEERFFLSLIVKASDANRPNNSFELADGRWISLDNDLHWSDGQPSWQE